MSVAGHLVVDLADLDRRADRRPKKTTRGGNRLRPDMKSDTRNNLITGLKRVPPRVLLGVIWALQGILKAKIGFFLWPSTPSLLPLILVRRRWRWPCPVPHLRFLLQRRWSYCRYRPWSMSFGADCVLCAQASHRDKRYSTNRRSFIFDDFDKIIKIELYRWQ